MNMILAKRPLGPNVVELVVEAPRIAARARAGQFAVVRLHERGERIPLTLADWDPGRGTITLVVQMVGKSTRELGERFGIGDTIRDVVGPLGSPSTIRRYGTVVCVGGGVGIAPIYPIARALRAEGNEVIAVVGARTKDLLLWLDRIAEVSSELHIATDDGSQGVKGVVTTPLQEVLATRKVAHVWAIGPAIMMKFCARTCQEFGVPATVSLNAIMLDGTGMCGACRVEVGGETRFTCVDGPEFPGDLVNWDLLLSRLGTFTDEERYALERYVAAQGGRS
ncbi:MAG TPA: sulfide/dihydroorotate dehydrogenase-like FAD/NAD-binding protein [Candidatus Bipolaricaulis anaerobius]|nr:sulfide/dihydroorotate dehydrogenase-like FAD/NAD-binding protein [Candidatus Bipolaricaulis sp.]MDD3748847.1 sulfide/dihydroorotate dehydrogenase-like FAD/NAD-binding protein [Candidatus Bipolaricaulis anaerobius]MDD5764396.1 sulfide/dihydroorotate dehydrogenase-like FAD/NAD-binding protein [Candidatus Bipolaricaulis anaerobius]HNR24267.1 sulfide/dihydroorotate dehydrogenase-like FAD/NAD-binding protein [Candidatus Bipolaricaulis anaerobius]HNS23650.1 sulfide/dihydroorotate dehydrogenase-li